MSLEIKHDEADNKFYTVIDGSEAYLRYLMVNNNTIEYDKNLCTE